MRSFVRQHPFLVIPMYVVWLGFTMLSVALEGADARPDALTWLLWVTSLVAGLAPYALADYLLARWRRDHRHHDPAT